jgi:MmgE/PrpD N-terminal domain
MSAHAAALLDWLACAYGGRAERAARVARTAGGGLLETVAWLGAAGHVLDFDDTYLPGMAHLSAPTAPAAVAVAADRERSVGDALDGHAAGFEAMGRLSRSHRLYEGGWHPTAVCGAAGAAVATATLLGLDEERTDTAMRLALLQAGGLRAAFGSEGKSLQVGMRIDQRRRRGRARRIHRRVRAKRRRRRPARGRRELDQAVAMLPDEPQRDRGGDARRSQRLGADQRDRASGRPPGGDV